MYAQMIEHGFREGSGLGGGIAAVCLLLVVPAVIVALIAYGTVVLWRHRVVPAGGGPNPAAPHAQHILDERFARGEIDADIYVRQSELLRATRDGTPFVSPPPMPVTVPAAPAPAPEAPTAVTEAVTTDD